MNQREEIELVTVPEAMRRTRVGHRQFRRAIRTGALTVYDLGSWPRVRWGDVLAWLEAQRRPVEDRAADTTQACEKTP